MKQEDVVTALREEVRHDRDRVSVLERVASGAASADELADLETLASSDARLARELEAAKPLGPDTEARIAARLLESANAPKKVSDASKATETAKVAPIAKAPSNVVPFQRRAMRRVAQLGAPLALAAALLLYFTTRGPASPDLGVDLPTYAVAVAGDKEMRGAPDESTRLVVSSASTSRFELLARPAQAVESDARVVAYAFVVRGGDVASLDDVKVDVSKDGAVRITGAARELEGATAVRIVVGTTPAITKFDHALERARTGKGDKRVLVLTVPVDRR